MKQKKYQKILGWAMLCLLFGFSFVFSASALAANNSNILWGNDEVRTYIRQNSGLPAESNVNDPRIIAANVIRFILGFLGIISVILVIYAGFKWMTSRGNEQTISEAKKTLIAALIGLVIILFSYALVEFVIRNIYEAAMT